MFNSPVNIGMFHRRVVGCTFYVITIAKTASTVSILVS